MFLRFAHPEEADRMGSNSRGQHAHPQRRTHESDASLHAHSINEADWREAQVWLRKMACIWDYRDRIESVMDGVTLVLQT